MSGYLQLLRVRWREIIVPLALVLLGTIPLVPVYGSAWLALAVGLGTLLGALVATLGAWRRWSTLTVVGLTLLALALGSPAAAPQHALWGAVPTPASIGAVAQGAVTSWKQVVTIAPPLGAGGNVLSAPFLLTLVATLVATTVSLRTRRASWALLAPALVLIAAILMGTLAERLVWLIGLLGTLGGLLWSRWRSRRLQLQRPVALGVLLAVACLGGLGAGTLGGQTPRFVLREVLEPPLDPYDYPSPLASFRSYLKDHRDETIMTVHNLPADTPIRLAAMDDYDGTAWGVSGARRAGPEAFRRVGERISIDRPADAVDVDVEVDEYRGVWVPGIEETHDVEFTGPRGEEQQRSLYYNRELATGIVTAGLREGDTYTMEVTPQDPPPVSALRGAPLGQVEQQELGDVPDVVPAEASTMVSGADSPIARAQALASELQDGYFSHGLEGSAPSLPGHGAARLADMLTSEIMIGDEEQYAAMMGLMGRSVGMPTRVVMGFAAQDEDAEVTTITGDDVTAWVEVAFADHGWVPFYPTPDEDRTPQTTQEEQKERPEPQVLQPPPPPQEPPEAPPMDRDDVEAEDEDVEEETDLGPVLIVVAAIGIPALLLVAPILLILGWKLRRRHHRRSRGAPATRMAGGWNELLDHAGDLGIALPRGATRSENAAALVSTLAERRSGTTTAPRDVSSLDAAYLAGATDAGTFGPQEPDEEAVHSYWQQLGHTLARLRELVGRRRWLRSRVSTRSLRRRR